MEKQIIFSKQIRSRAVFLIGLLFSVFAFTGFGIVASTLQRNKSQTEWIQTANRKTSKRNLSLRKFIVSCITNKKIPKIDQYLINKLLVFEFLVLSQFRNLNHSLQTYSIFQDGLLLKNIPHQSTEEIITAIQG